MSGNSIRAAACLVCASEGCSCRCLFSGHNLTQRSRLCSVFSCKEADCEPPPGRLIHVEACESDLGLDTSASGCIIHCGSGGFVRC